MKRRSSPQQLRIDSLLLPSQKKTVEEKVIYNGIHVSQSTFQAGLAARVHRWFRLTPSFGPDLVREMLSRLECGSNDVVLDPFAGAGTTMIECQLEGKISYGFELNPFLRFVGSTSLNWQLNLPALKRSLENTCSHFERLNRVISIHDLASHGLAIPRIHNPERWWRQDILKELVLLKKSIDEVAPTKEIKDLLRLAFAGVLVPDLTNVTLGRLQLHFIDRSTDAIDVRNTFADHCNRIISDLIDIRKVRLKQTSKILHADCTHIGILKMENPVNCVITSPPYPNRYSYTWNTRPHLYLFDFISTAKEASNLDKSTVGGTWGSATSDLAKGKIEPEYDILDRVVRPVVDEIRRRDVLMANYAMKYFNLLTKQIISMDHLLAKNARVAYVVGCSRLSGVYVETDVLLGKIFEGLGLGYRVSCIERIRKRHSGKDLHESIVYAWKR